MRLINADELKKVIDKYCEDYQGFDGVIDIIDNAPTVEQEVYMTGKDYDLYLEGYKQGKIDFSKPQGEWEQYTNTDEMLNIWSCSNCKEEFCSEIGGNPHEWNYNFCPNCGARMGGG